ncbi:unnamed protein product [Rhizophagus irregularis]|nr:unnamed protein product [Rhizophagus irregularis]
MKRNNARNRDGECLPEKYDNSKGSNDLEMCARLTCIKNEKTWCPCLQKERSLYLTTDEVIVNILGPSSSIRQPDFLKSSKHPQGLELVIYHPYALIVQSIILSLSFKTSNSNLLSPFDIVRNKIRILLKLFFVK